MFKKTRKKIAFLCATALLVVTMCIPAFAATPPRSFTYVTFDDSSDFTIVDQGLITFEDEILLVGLDYSQPYPYKVAFDADELQYITWDSDSIRVILYDNNEPWDFGYHLTGTDNVGAMIIAQGTSSITATYAPAGGTTQSVSSYVVSEFTTQSSVSNVNVTIDGVQSPDITATGQTIPLFSLKTVFGSSFDDVDVMQNRPTALHALLYVLENYHSAQDPAYSNDGYTVNDPEYWDWVNETRQVGEDTLHNAEVQSSGSYVYAIGDDIQYTDPVTYDFYGWQFTYPDSSVSPDHAASVTPLSSGNTVTFYFAPYVY